MGDYRTTTGESRPMTPRETKRRRRRLALGVFLILIISMVIGSIIKVPRKVTATGYVTTEQYAEVRPSSEGTISEILVKTGDQVEQGQILARLNASEEKAMLEEARSRVKQAEAKLARRRATIKEEKRELKENIEIAKLRLENATTKLKRNQELSEKGLVAGTALDDAKLEQELARAELASLLNKDPSVFDKELSVLKEELAGRRQEVEQAKLRLKNKEIRAPVAGQVLRYEFVIGELVRPQNILYEIFGGENQVLKLRIPEQHATKIAVGQSYEASLAPYRGLNEIEFRGEVKEMRNVIQKEGQTSYRVVSCTFDAQDYRVPPGTTAQADIHYGKSNLWLFLFGVN